MSDEHDDPGLYHNSVILPAEMKPKVYRCTKGHETTGWHNDLSITNQGWTRTFCLRCIEEMLVDLGIGEFR